MHTTNSPVAAIIFNRPDKAQKIYQQIRQARPQKLYIIADGPRPTHPTDKENCLKTREIYDHIDWDCEVFKNYSDENLGCGLRIFTGLSWVFSQEERAIILEDDCLPDPTFFQYCDELLERYKEDSRIMMVAGSNIHEKWTTDYSYFFARFGSIHGWATWRRAWQKVDLELTLWHNPSVRKLLKQSLGGWQFYFLSRIYDELYAQRHKPHTWDYQFDFARFVHSGLAIVPSVNLVSNIGFGQDSTHTKAANPKVAEKKIYPMSFPLSHPPYVMPDLSYDRLVRNILFPKKPIIWLWVIKNELNKYVRRFFQKAK